MYILYSIRATGWLTAGGTYTSDRTLAAQFNYDTMLRQCARHYRNGMTEFGLLPVSLTHLNEIVKAAA